MSVCFFDLSANIANVCYIETFLFKKECILFCFCFEMRHIGIFASDGFNGLSWNRGKNNCGIVVSGLIYFILLHPRIGACRACEPRF